jgi:hypothetical protein
LHIVEADHSFVEDMVDHAGTTAQRVRIGLTGLAFAFLLVLLGSVISRSSDDRSPAEKAADVNAVANQEPSEPLAELGVAPGGSEKAADVNKVANQEPSEPLARPGVAPGGSESLNNSNTTAGDAQPPK